MLSPIEVDDFVAGRIGDLLELSYSGSDLRVRFERNNEANIIVRIPVRSDERQDVFDISSALSHPMCGVAFSKNENEFVVQVAKRHQIRSVIKISLNHLGWVDEEKVKRIFCEHAGQ